MLSCPVVITEDVVKPVAFIPHIYALFKVITKSVSVTDILPDLDRLAVQSLPEGYLPFLVLNLFIFADYCLFQTGDLAVLDCRISFKSTYPLLIVVMSIIGFLLKLLHFIPDFFQLLLPVDEHFVHFLIFTGTPLNLALLDI